MGTIVYRAPTEAEISRAGRVFLTSVFDLAARNGQPAPQHLTPEVVDLLQGHIFRTGIFEVAEDDGQFLAVCHAIVRDRLWFLSGFWVLPEHQGHKIGGPLLRRVFEEGKRRGATTAFTWSSVDHTAMATYMKMGMLPGFQMLTFSGALENPPDRPPGYQVEPLHAQVAASIDGEVRGTRRDLDHAFWLSGQATAREVKNGGRTAGYFYAGNGTVGPAAWLRPEHAEAILYFAFSAAQAQSKEIRVMIPGINHAAITYALKSGLRLVSTAHLLSTQPFGKLDQYLASGPLLF
jgi:GNAT superfamily N-acetyltransferase